MTAVISLLLVLTIAMIVIRVASVALVHTGMGHEAARFQDRSPFKGAGFTTGEAESVVDHPVRRRIVAWLMLAGNVGIVTAMSSSLLSFVAMRGHQSAWLLREDYGVSELRVETGSRSLSIEEVPAP